VSAFAFATEEVPGSALAEPTKQHIRADYYDTFAAKPIRLDSDAGRALLRVDSPDYAPLLESWIAQLKSHCGAASSVVVLNSLLPGAGFTQNSIFNPSTAHIISQETVYRIGFTLEELTDMIRATSALRAERFHAGAGEGEHAYEAWLAALRANRDNPRTRIICNFATGWLRDRKNTGGHFSPVADYNEAENKVLILEVSGGRPAFWVDAREMYDAMNQVDKVCDRVRGWIVVARD
jgi:hypothetical protein